MIPFIHASLHLSHTDGPPSEKIEKVLRANDELFRSYGIRISFDVSGSLSDEVGPVVGGHCLGVGSGCLQEGFVDPDKSYIIINDKYVVPIEGDVSTLARKLADTILAIIVESGQMTADAEDSEYMISFREPPGRFGATEYVLEAA